ncbi:carbohydrate-binding module family 32 protein [Sporormia fimetaria CBS 119925]|uniref:alpha,alpha-trehalase n=1 Tax=Sporormia fimetaria CBS 119925 TaxID=1340428 RepID=A0A6A6VFQ7_9PLEO|nr:carbohydrate-binding module family 32 protein [Sporormia fimetaria CBS 119925]
MRLAGLLLLPFIGLLHSIVSAAVLHTGFRDVFWDDDTWSLINHNFARGDFRHRMSLANGYLGINVAATGPFYEYENATKGEDTDLNGWPLENFRSTFATIAGFYGWFEELTQSNYPWLNQYGGESVISGIPHWAGLYVEADGALLNATVEPQYISDFEAALNISAGEMSWDYVWTPSPNNPIHVQYRMLVHKLHVNKAAIQLTLTALSRETDVTVYDVLEGDGAERTESVEKGAEKAANTIWSAVRPVNITEVTAYIYSTVKAYSVQLMSRTTHMHYEGVVRANESSIAQSFDLYLPLGKPVRVEKFVGAASSDAFPDPQSVAQEASSSGALLGYDMLRTSHVAEWQEILPRHSVDRYHLQNGSLPEDVHIRGAQIMAVTNPFYILQNTVGPNAILAAKNPRLGVDSIPVCGLGSDCYGGFIMWDADVWMAPGLQVSHPHSMRQVTRYRREKFEQAQKNVGMAFSSSKADRKFHPNGAVYPWTSGRYGNCTATGPCFDYEYHLNGDIGISLYNELVTTGDDGYFKEDLLPIMLAISHFYNDLLSYDKEKDLYYVSNATDPDEYANNIDQPAFTTALIQTHLNLTNHILTWFGEEEEKRWRDVAAKLRMPIDEKTSIIKEYEGMTGNVDVKQADVVLIDDLLHFHQKESLRALDYYAAKQSRLGPGMTYAAYSIVANELSPSGCASYTYDLYSSQPYARAPWYQFSEQLIDESPGNGGVRPGFPFLTGMGGANRIAIFGYLGLHLLLDKLEIDPSLPPQIPWLTYRTFYWQGHGIQAVSNQTHTMLTRSGHSLHSANGTYNDRSIPVHVRNEPHLRYLYATKPLIVPNRHIGQMETVRGNILQCEIDVWATGDSAPGQIPLAAIDGAASTKWQPADARDIAYLTIDMGDRFYPINKVLFDWGQHVPVHYKVLTTNASHGASPYDTLLLDDYRNVTSSCAPAKISVPWVPSNEIKLYKGNTTNCTLPSPIWSGRYVHLGVNGSQAYPHANEKYNRFPTKAKKEATATALFDDSSSDAIVEEEQVDRWKPWRPWDAWHTWQAWKEEAVETVMSMGTCVVEDDDDDWDWVAD